MRCNGHCAADVESLLLHMYSLCMYVAHHIKTQYISRFTVSEHDRSVSHLVHPLWEGTVQGLLQLQGSFCNAGITTSQLPVIDEGIGQSLDVCCHAVLQTQHHHCLQASLCNLETWLAFLEYS